ncbi:MAG: DUF3443 domain-containing protein [Candidatus Sulfotelmatobacter sp.]
MNERPVKELRIFLLLAAWSTLVFLGGCGGGKSNSLPPNPIVTSGSNVAPIEVNTGPPDSGLAYANGAFVSVTVCAPGTSTCQTIPYILVDTGSYGLRIVSSLLTVPLTQEMASDGNAMVECLQFLDSYTWGPVQAADIEIASEKASSVAIQVLSDTDFTVPSSCSSKAAGGSADMVSTLGANGILGVGQFPQDCGSNTTCPASADQYYSCASATAACTPVAATVAQQVPNPVTLFATDNNGVIIELPAVSSPEATVSGSLVFGIGTESNNSLNGATVYTADPTNLNFTTAFNGVNYTNEGFLDSGSNGYFFPDSNIAACPSTTGANGFYCPSGTVNLSATNKGNNGSSGTVNFSVANAENLFSNAPNDAAYPDLGGPASGYFDWGLPFFYGRNVFTSIEGKTAPGGTTPYWAY